MYEKLSKIFVGVVFVLFAYLFFSVEHYFYGVVLLLMLLFL